MAEGDDKVATLLRLHTISSDIGEKEKEGGRELRYVIVTLLRGLALASRISSSRQYHNVYVRTYVYQRSPCEIQRTYHYTFTIRRVKQHEDNVYRETDGDIFVSRYQRYKRNLSARYGINLSFRSITSFTETVLLWLAYVVVSIPLILFVSGENV